VPTYAETRHDTNDPTSSRIHACMRVSGDLCPVSGVALGSGIASWFRAVTCSPTAQARTPLQTKKDSLLFHSSFICGPLRMTTLFSFRSARAYIPFPPRFVLCKRYVHHHHSHVNRLCFNSYAAHAMHTYSTLCQHRRTRACLRPAVFFPEENCSAWGAQVFCRPLYPYMHSCFSRFIHSPLAPAVYSSGLLLYYTARLYSVVI